MTVVLRWLTGFGRFWYGFIIGDDWTVAATMAGAPAATCLYHAARGGRVVAAPRPPRQAPSG